MLGGLGVHNVVIEWETLRDWVLGVVAAGPVLLKLWEQEWVVGYEVRDIKGEGCKLRDARFWVPCTP